MAATNTDLPQKTSTHVGICAYFQFTITINLSEIQLKVDSALNVCYLNTIFLKVVSTSKYNISNRRPRFKRTLSQRENHKNVLEHGAHECLRYMDHTILEALLGNNLLKRHGDFNASISMKIISNVFVIVRTIPPAATTLKNVRLG